MCVNHGKCCGYQLKVWDLTQEGYSLNSEARVLTESKPGGIWVKEIESAAIPRQVTPWCVLQLASLPQRRAPWKAWIGEGNELGEKVVEGVQIVQYFLEPWRADILSKGGPYRRKQHLFLHSNLHLKLPLGELTSDNMRTKIG